MRSSNLLSSAARRARYCLNYDARDVSSVAAKRLISTERSRVSFFFSLQWLIARFKRARGCVTRISSGSRTPRYRGGEISARARVNFSRVSRVSRILLLSSWSTQSPPRGTIFSFPTRTRYPCMYVSDFLRGSHLLTEATSPRSTARRYFFSW